MPLQPIIQERCSSYRNWTRNMANYNYRIPYRRQRPLAPEPDTTNTNGLRLCFMGRFLIPNKLYTFHYSMERELPKLSC